ncbi:MAG: hypothetical protein WBW14_02830 [Candidatus Acidiferrum sp.]
MKRSSRLAVTILVLAWRGAPFAAPAQDNYEIQVYGAETVEKGHAMVELHSNFTERGNTTSTDGTIPTNHQLHETLEITHGFTSWFETGFYPFHNQDDFGIPDRLLSKNSRGKGNEKNDCGKLLPGRGLGVGNNGAGGGAYRPVERAGR